MAVLLLAILFIGVVFTLLYGGATLLAAAWTSRFRPRIPTEQSAPAVGANVADEAEAWLRTNPLGPDPTTYPGN